MIRRRGLAAALLGVALCSAIAEPASARVDPSRVESDVDVSMREGDYRFCKQPREPLSRAARALCPRASSVRGCEGFAAACARSSARRWSFDLPAWLAKAIGWAIAWAARLVAWVLLPGLVLALLVPALRALARKRPEQAPASPVAAVATSLAAPEAAPPADEDALLARADEQAHRQAYGVALELYLAASLASLDRRGALELGRDRTNGEYVRACREVPARPPLRELAAAVDRVKFGGQAATPEGAERAGAVARSIVQGLGASLAALAVLACLGCGGASWPGVPRPGDDPAGHELLVDVLRRQGFQAGELRGALSSLPMPAPGETTPAVVVDLEETEVDEESGDHLVRWVEAGGSLVLAGLPERWPKELRIAPAWTDGAGHVEVRRLLAHGVDVQAARVDEEEEQDEDDTAPVAAPIYASTTEHADVVSGAGLRSEAGERVAWLGDGTTYAVRVSHGLGSVIGVATGELLTNVALARAGSAMAALALLSNADRDRIEIARPEDGVSPPSTPLAAMQRAGLGLGLAHALVAALLLFLARGVRLRRPANEPPPARRAFVEHVEAVGALYRRGGHAAHALAAFARFAEQRLRARMPHGASDIPSLLASRGGVPLEAAARLWARSTTVNAAAPVGDELGILKELAAAYSRAVDPDR